MSKIRSVPVPAFFCAFAVLLCELLSQPWAEMSVADDWSYVRTAQRLAETGHIYYNGWANAMLGWQLYLAAALIRVFGFSFFTVRGATLLTSMATAFLLQRTFARALGNERNAMLAALTIALSPLYLMLTGSFMTDIGGLFAVVVCLYGCLRALEATDSTHAVRWLWFASLTNAVCGTSRQIAWLGALVMVPCTLWLLRKDRRVLLMGLPAIALAWAIIVGGMHWFHAQPYALPESALPDSRVHISIARMIFICYSKISRELPFLIAPLMVLFIPGVVKKGRAATIAAATCTAAYMLYAWRVWTHPHLPAQPRDTALEPMFGDWVGPHARLEYFRIFGESPVVLTPWMRAVITVLCIGGLMCLAAVLLSRKKTDSNAEVTTKISWYSLAVLLGPFSLVYTLLLVHRWLEDRYLLPIATLAALVVVRVYQERIQPRVPSSIAVFLALSAIAGISCTHNNFAFARARISAVKMLESHGIPETSIDAGSEYSGWTELKHADHVNDSRIVNPPNAYVPVPFTGRCTREWGAQADEQIFPHVVPVYDLSFDPNACGGPSAFGPTYYTTWPTMLKTPVYVVKERPNQ